MRGPGRALFRADAGARVGTGHVMRCLALSQAWRARGGRSTFLMNPGSPALEARIKAERAAVVLASVRPGSSSDALRTVAEAERCGADWIVTDGYGFGPEYQRRLKAAGRRLLVIDDHGHAGSYWADIVLDQNITTRRALYVRRGPETKLLLGPDHTLLRREFWGRSRRMKAISVVGRRLLVAMGGSDPGNVTGKILTALNKNEDLETIVLVGGSNARGSALTALACAAKGRVRIERDSRRVADRMAWADAAVSAGGTTAGELVFMGVPSLLISLAANQLPVVAALAARGAAIDLGPRAGLTPARIREAVEGLLGDASRRARLSRRGRVLVDGRGGERVVAAMRDVLKGTL